MALMTRCVKDQRAKGVNMTGSDNGRRSIVSKMRRAMLFTVGSALLLREKAQEFVEQAIERGQEVQNEGRKLVQETRVQRKKQQPTRIDALDVRINNALERLNVPAQKDIEQLNQHITELSKKIDELKSSQ
jgi:polyhydroxyalkanoate synthesis regulator phasin